jgi:hypothetical protein
MSLADAIAKANAANERKLTEQIQVPQLFDADAALLLDSFSRYCAFHGVVNCPANSKVVAAFVRSEASLGTHPDRIVSVLGAIELFHHTHGLSNPVATAVVRHELEKVIKSEPPPRSWKPAEKLMWAALAPEIRAVIGGHERRRETEVRRLQNVVADLKRQMAAAETKPANTEPNKEVENHDNP